MFTSICRFDAKNANHAIRISEHEKAILMIDDVFILNRLRSYNFMYAVENQIISKKESLNDLG